MSKTKLVIGLLLVFILGALCGALGMGFYVKHQADSFVDRKPGKRADFFFERLSSQLDLTEEQKPRIKEIMRDMEESMRAFRERNFPELQKTFEHHQQLILQELTEEQRKKFDALHKRMGRRRPFFGRHGPPRGPFGDRKPPMEPPPPPD